MTINKSGATAPSEQPNGWSVIDETKFIAKKPVGHGNTEYSLKMKLRNKIQLLII